MDKKQIVYGHEDIDHYHYIWPSIKLKFIIIIIHTNEEKNLITHPKCVCEI